MQQTLIDHPRLSVRLVTGTEGPRHDPYSYTEWHVKTPEGETVVHEGLSLFAVIGNQRIEAGTNDYKNGMQWCDRILEDRAGYTSKQLERIFHKRMFRCPMGGRHDTITMPGMIGETFEYCEKCGKFIDAWFCAEAVI